MGGYLTPPIVVFNRIIIYLKQVPVKLITVKYFL